MASSVTTAMLGQTDCTTSTFTAPDSPNDLRTGFKLSESWKRGAYMTYRLKKLSFSVNWIRLCECVSPRMCVFVMSNRVMYWLSS